MADFFYQVGNCQLLKELVGWINIVYIFEYRSSTPRSFAPASYLNYYSYGTETHLLYMSAYPVAAPANYWSLVCTPLTFLFINTLLSRGVGWL
jgi:hypothetical protein